MLNGSLHGWLVIDKPIGVTSSRVVDLVRRRAGTKVGHAGTLDPLASGVLPIAIGEATKTTAYAMAARKRYRFRIRWGIARSTDDREGDIIGECAVRPNGSEIEAILPGFIGTILQTPPTYSAIKVSGHRSYALARANRPAALSQRPIEISELRLIAVPDRDHADCEALVGKGAYIRALARDLGIALGTLAHIAELRRLAVGPFSQDQAIALDSITEHGHITMDCRYLLPIEAALDDIPAVVLTGKETARLRCGQKLAPGDAFSDLSRYRHGAVVGAWHEQVLIALARIEEGCLRPIRVFNH
ncbi:MAG: tRNA pseudouridine(55) synthase TruB [Stellaceae bacterium]